MIGSALLNIKKEVKIKPPGLIMAFLQLVANHPNLSLGQKLLYLNLNKMFKIQIMDQDLAQEH